MPLSYRQPCENSDLKSITHYTSLTHNQRVANNYAPTYMSLNKLGAITDKQTTNLRWLRWFDNDDLISR